ncbi:MAG: hypothetical protein K1X94_21400 [Sandaracinaceae bacterium]|nr:hypothetical protein [Sandaracinaceae bacterium]
MIRVGDIGGSPVAAIITPSRNPDEAGLVQVWVFIDLDTERALLAFRVPEPTPDIQGDPYCGIFDAGIGADALALTVLFYDFDVSGDVLEREWTTVLRAESADARGTLRALYRDDYGAGASVMRVSPSHVAALYSWENVFAFGNDGSVLRPTYGLEEFYGPKSNLELVAGSDLIWDQFRSPTVMVGSRNGAVPTVLRSVDGGETRGSDIRSTTADGNTLAWLEARGWDDAAREYASVELWTGTYESGAIVRARRVAEVDGHSGGTVGAGYYVHPEPDPEEPMQSHYVFYRLADGAIASADPAPLAANDVFFVSDDVVIVSSYGQIFWLDPRTLTFEAP